MTEVVCENTKKQVLFYINNFWNNNYTDFVFPLTKPLYITKDNYQDIKKYYKFLVRNSSSKRAILILYKNHNDENKQYILLKDNTLLELNLFFEEDYYSGSIFDIDYLEMQPYITDNLTTKDILFSEIYISDTFMSKGIIFSELNYSLRYEEALNFSAKNNVKINKIYSSIKEIILKDSEEVYFIPEKLPLNNNYVFIWKPPESVTFSLLCKEEKEFINLYTTNFRINKIFAKAKNNLARDIKNLENYKNNCIINVNIKDNNFIPESVSKDISFQSSIRYIEDAIYFKQQNIQFHDIF